MPGDVISLEKTAIMAFAALKIPSTRLNLSVPVCFAPFNSIELAELWVNRLIKVYHHAGRDRNMKASNDERLNPSYTIELSELRIRSYRGELQNSGIFPGSPPQIWEAILESICFQATIYLGILHAPIYIPESG